MAILVWPFLHPATVSKIEIVGSDFLSTLRQQIADENIPNEYGGTLDLSWNWPQNYSSPSTSVPSK